MNGVEKSFGDRFGCCGLLLAKVNAVVVLLRNVNGKGAADPHAAPQFNPAPMGAGNGLIDGEPQS